MPLAVGRDHEAPAIEQFDERARGVALAAMMRDLQQVYGQPASSRLRERL